MSNRPAAPHHRPPLIQGTWRTYVQLALGMALFGSALPVAKIVANGFPVFTGSALRVAIAVIALAPWLLRDGFGLPAVGRRDWLVLALVALFGMFGFSVFMMYGMAMVSGVVGSIVMSTRPAVTAAGAFLFFRERLGAEKAGGIALAVAGVLVLHLTGGGQSDGVHAGGRDLLLGSALVFAAVCCEAAYTLLGKLATARLSPLRVGFWSALLSLPLFLPFAAAEWPAFDWRAVPILSWLAVLWWGGATMGLGSVLWYAGVARAEGSVSAGFMGVMPVSALLLSYLLLGEPFRWPHLLGFAVVFAGVLLIAQAHARDA